MEFPLSYDWKFVVAVGGSIAGIIAVKKLDSAAIENISIHAIDMLSKFLNSTLKNNSLHN